MLSEYYTNWAIYPVPNLAFSEYPYSLYPLFPAGSILKAIVQHHRQSTHTCAHKALNGFPHIDSSCLIYTHTYIHTYIHTYTHTHTHTHTHTNIHQKRKKRKKIK